METITKRFSKNIDLCERADVLSIIGTFFVITRQRMYKKSESRLELLGSIM